MLHEIHYDIKGHLWCGPVSLATITGRTLLECTNALRDSIYGPRWRDFKRAPAIKGTCSLELIIALDKFGYQVDISNMRILGDEYYLKKLKEFWPSKLTKNKSYIIGLMARGKDSGHWIVVEGKLICDTWTQGTPTHIDDLTRNQKALLTRKIDVIMPVSEKID